MIFFKYVSDKKKPKKNQKKKQFGYYCEPEL